MSQYQFNYAPNFHGYLSEAMRRCIEKSLTERVVGFWKYESSWGKFKFSDWVSLVAALTSTKADNL